MFSRLSRNSQKKEFFNAIIRPNNAGLLQVVNYLDSIQNNEAALRNILSTTNDSAISQAAAVGNLFVVTSLLDAAKKIGEFQNAGKVALNEAASRGHLTLVHLLLKLNIPANFENQRKQTPLSLAASQGHTPVVQLLIDYNADTTHKNAINNTAEDFARQNNYQDCVVILQKAAFIQAAREGRLIPFQNSLPNYINDSILLNKAQEEASTHPALLNALRQARFIHAAEVGDIESLSTFLDFYKNNAEILAQAEQVAANNNHSSLIKHLRKRQFFLSAENGSLDGILNYIRNYPNEVDIRDNGQNTALICAAQHGHLNVVQTLIQHGAKEHLKNSAGFTATQMATKARKLDVENYLIESRFHAEAQEGNLDYFKNFIAKNANKPNALDIKDNQGNTALILAAKGGHTQLVQYLINHNADPRIQIQTLQIALRNNPVLNRLVQQRMDVLNFIDTAGQTDEKSITFVTKYAKTHTHLLNERNLSGDSALIIAVKQGNTAVTKLLLDLQAEVNLIGKEGLSAKQLAFRSNNNDLINLFRQQELDLFFKDVADNNQAQVKSYLDNHPKSDIDQCDAAGNSALMIAAAYGHLSITELLLNQGANIAITNNEKLTAEDIAINHGHINLGNTIAIYPTINQKLKKAIEDPNYTFHQRISDIGQTADNYPDFQDTLQAAHHGDTGNYHILENPIQAFGYYFDYTNLINRFRNTDLIDIPGTGLQLDFSVLSFPVDEDLKARIKTTVEREEVNYEISQVVERRKLKVPQAIPQTVAEQKISPEKEDLQARRMKFFTNLQKGPQSNNVSTTTPSNT